MKPELTGRGTEMIDASNLCEGDTIVRLGGELSIVLNVWWEYVRHGWFVNLVHHDGDKIIFWTVGPMRTPRFERVL